MEGAYQYGQKIAASLLAAIPYPYAGEIVTHCYLNNPFFTRRCKLAFIDGVRAYLSQKGLNS